MTEDGSKLTVAEATEVWHLRLYIAGRSAKSQHAVENLKTICDEHLAGRHEVEIIDLAEQPSLARSEDVLAIPTLVRRLPAPVRKVIGDLSDTERVLIGLRVEPR